MKTLNSFRKFNYIVFLLIFFINSFSALRSQQLSEVMFAPTVSNSEFVEIFNNTESAINLNGFKIKYSTSSADEIISTDSNYVLHPGKYAIIFEADYDITTGIYSQIISQETLIFILDDNAFGSSGMSNSSDRTIYLINANEDTLDVYTYSANNSKGFSDERINYDDNLWDNSTIENGTPGRRNSVSPNMFDVELSEFSLSSNYVIVGEILESTIKVKNLGTESAENFLFTVDLNESQIHNESLKSLPSGDSAMFEISISGFINGTNLMRAHIEYTEDEYLDNNYLEKSVHGIFINEEMGDIVINEFMSSPNNPEPEWIELYNISEKEINIKNYNIADASDTVRVVHENILLYPQEYIVLADDSSFNSVFSDTKNVLISNLPTLNNSGDKIILLDSLYRVIDSLVYDNNWNGKSGYSFEKIDPFGISNDPLNWSATKISTPGKINSVTQKEFDLKIDTIITIPKNALVGTKTKLAAKMKNTGKQRMESSVWMFDDINADSIGNHIIEESHTFSVSPTEEVLIEFTQEIEVTNYIKNFVFKLNVKDDDSTNNNYIYQLKPSYKREAIVINEILYSPINYEPEWIELVNNSEYDIKLTGWEISDILTNPISKKIEEEIIIKANEYLVISKSGSIFEFHRNIDSKIIELAFANLNNDEDGVVLKDDYGKTIDSVKYNVDWNGIKGISIERKSIIHNSNSRNNWGNSTDLEGSTPGRINSVTPKNYDLAITSSSTLPLFPVKGEEINIRIKINNYGNKIAENFSINFYLLEQNNWLLFEEQENFNLLAGDSIFINSSVSLMISDTLEIEVKVVFENDQDDGNNIITKTIIPGFNMNTVLINEVFFKPQTGMSEWIEIINNTDSVINLNGWLIGDSKEKVIITNEDVYIEPNEFSIICSNSGILNFESADLAMMTNLPELNDTKDAVVIYDFRNAIIDSFYYSVSNNFGNGMSLERIDLGNETSNLDNWSFSLDQNGSSPWQINSVSKLPDINFGDIIITEIMYDPSETNSEFIEIFNTSEIPIEIGGWKLKYIDKDITISNKSFFLNPQEYFVISADSNLLNHYEWLINHNNISIINASSLSLTNSGSKITLADVKNNIVDSLFYTESWHNKAMLETKNVSLELLNTDLRRNSGSNWSSSVNALGATPARVNSISVDKKITKSKLEISPNPFSPDNDGFEDFTFISYSLTEPISQIRIRIFDSKGRFIKSLTENVFTGSSGSIVFDGLDSNNTALKIGIYIILFEAINSNNSVVETIKDVVVIARKL